MRKKLQPRFGFANHFVFIMYFKSYKSGFIKLSNHLGPAILGACLQVVMFSNVYNDICIIGGGVTP